MLHRKTVADAFWNAELENELRQRGWIHSCFKNTQSKEKLMDDIDGIRANSIYLHNECSDDCQKKRYMHRFLIYVYIYNHLVCGTLYSIDGNWKICYPHCMWRTADESKSYEGCLQYVDCCLNEPVPSSALCEKHLEEAKKRSIPTKIKEYVDFCSKNGK